MLFSLSLDTVALTERAAQTKSVPPVDMGSLNTTSTNSGGGNILTGPQTPVRAVLITGVPIGTPVVNRKKHDERTGVYIRRTSLAHIELDWHF